MDSPALEISQLSIKFKSNNQKEITVLKMSVSTINSNEFVSIIGPSGCGKSTLLRAAAGLERPQFGKRRVDGHIVTHREQIAVWFFKPHLVPMAHNL
jgi:NitT/TauT family transport system ATP-binding protein